MKKVLGVLLVVVPVLLAAGQDKSKKAYELMYDDIQQLKLQVQRLEKKADAAADDLKSVREFLRDLTAQFKSFQAGQARSDENLKSLPMQLQVFLEKFGQLESQILKISEDLIDLKSRPAVEVPASAAKPGDKAPVDKTPAGQKPAPSKKEPAPKEKTAAGGAPIQTNLSPQDVYKTAYADYQKGTYALAIDGFQTLVEQFPTNPLADDALYMIGECYYSQKKFAPAIEQFDELIVNYPASNKMASAYLKKGYCLAELKRKDEAIAVLRFLVNRYSLDEEAKSAQAKIKELLEEK
jgi:tol-pal system protein YbgF